MSAERNKSESSAFASGRLVHKWGERFCLDIQGIWQKHAPAFVGSFNDHK
jgi:hypothetical protein